MAETHQRNPRDDVQPVLAAREATGLLVQRRLSETQVAAEERLTAALIATQEKLATQTSRLSLLSLVFTILAVSIAAAQFLG